jgi:F-type H+-transporting ATPase subunit epsilon
MENKKTKLKIITPNGIFFEKEVEIVTLKTTEGFIGIQKNHIPFVGALEIAPLYIEKSTNKEHSVYAIAGGLVYADKDKVDIITDAIEQKDHIDINRAMKAKIGLENDLKKAKDDGQVKVINISLQKAMNRIKVKKEQ